MKLFSALLCLINTNIDFMAKRFINTELLASPNIRLAPTLYKLFWVGLITRTDHAGIWVKDFEMMSLLCGGKIEEEEAKKYFREHVIDIDNGKRWFIPGFIEFQYPKGLNEKVQAHKSVMQILEKFDLLKDGKVRVNQTLNEGFQDMDKDTVQVMDQEKDEVKDLDKYQKPKKEEKLQFPWYTANFKTQWEHWKVYKKKEFKFDYKSIQSEQAALTELSNLAGGNEIKAISIIHQSMSNGWKGFFELKTKNNTDRSNKTNAEIYREAINSEAARNFKFQ